MGARFRCTHGKNDGDKGRATDRCVRVCVFIVCVEGERGVWVLCVEGAWGRGGVQVRTCVFLGVLVCLVEGTSTTRGWCGWMWAGAPRTP